ncbi:amidohydrolase family protein [Aliivibrio sp. S4TY2]|uniref:metal-dependent hydrolase family protein n=1 Tax=unclassified Aliivibrio TaxID=2645654 RepID=UPI0023796515|nr:MULTISPECIES: amidohydrolase family protein [unclassified Aliivibrio]MDD9156634.1 amidohydrolase family protein [Aliivibrio sp. S4TY2]MDD9159929.1 amidohydrolase family protein [Aliivibrio sp. S4TY1]MDD9164151.1 amidohydrolase family protein [Aliivibrio sp. S4MY2]MDD9168341.1 amidohydrolase family protein [Aliivibrio sp. S4MY4]MDD9184677.1 amidohydrolase family protein [Aliivibrio sp. S4MY3]
MKNVLRLTALALSCGAAFSASASSTLFTNVDIFNGTENKLYEDHYVLVENNLIKTISAKPIEAGDAVVINGEGKTLMPGLIEGHGHLQMNGSSLPDIENNRNWEELAARSAARAESALMSGFTTWRDAGGMGAGLKKTIDSGELDGPRIYPSGAFIGPTGSHADFRNFNTPNETFNGPISSGGRLGMSCTADSIGDIKACARQNYMQGATQIKLMSSGGVASSFDPWQLNAYSLEELKAAVEVADAYGSYAMSHAYSKVSLLRNVEAGVKTLEHAFMFDKDVAKAMKENGTYMTTNMTAFSPYLGEIEAINSNPASARKAKTAQAAFGGYIENVKKYKPKLGFHVDCVGGVAACEQQADHSIYLSGKFFGNFYTLISMTSVNGEIVKLSGETLDPYFEGKLGVIEPGAYADILLVDGNPLKDLSVIGANEKWFDAPAREGIDGIKLIMKDGKIYKNTL